MTRTVRLTIACATVAILLAGCGVKASTPEISGDRIPAIDEPSSTLPGSTTTGPESTSTRPTGPASTTTTTTEPESATTEPSAPTTTGPNGPTDPGADIDAALRQALIDGFVESGLDKEQSECLADFIMDADASEPDYEDYFKQCGIDPTNPGG